MTVVWIILGFVAGFILGAGWAWSGDPLTMSDSRWAQYQERLRQRSPARLREIADEIESRMPKEMR